MLSQRQRRSARIKQNHETQIAEMKAELDRRESAMKDLLLQQAQTIADLSQKLERAEPPHDGVEDEVDEEDEEGEDEEGEDEEDDGEETEQVSKLPPPPVKAPKSSKTTGATAKKNDEGIRETLKRAKLKREAEKDERRKKRHRSRSSSSSSSSSTTPSERSSTPSDKSKGTRKFPRRAFTSADKRAYTRQTACQDAASMIWGKSGRELGVYSKDFLRFMKDPTTRCGQHATLKNRLVATEAQYPNQVRDIMKAVEKLSRPGPFHRDILSSADVLAEYAAAFLVLESKQKSTAVGQYYAAISELPRYWKKRPDDFKAEVIISPCSTVLGSDAHPEYTGGSQPAKDTARTVTTGPGLAIGRAFPTTRGTTTIRGRGDGRGRGRGGASREDACNNCHAVTVPPHRGFQCMMACTRGECVNEGVPVGHTGAACPRRPPRRL